MGTGLSFGQVIVKNISYKTAFTRPIYYIRVLRGRSLKLLIVTADPAEVLPDLFTVVLEAVRKLLRKVTFRTVSASWMFLHVLVQKYTVVKVIEERFEYYLPVGVYLSMCRKIAHNTDPEHTTADTVNGRLC